ncbi:MAG: RNA polymerase sigma factor FliA [Gammaproteobacteria bacterium]|nr:RNA polymerase sigma factor FliA [Gammaproteobacteria bacterium]
MEATLYGDGETDNQEALVREHLPLVKKIGLHLVAKLPPSIELDDLLQVGVIGLIQAGATYDHSRGASFATYAGIRIKGAMLDEVRRNDWVPRTVQQNLRRVSEAIGQIEARLGQSASDKQIAQELGMSLEEYHAMSADLVHSRLVSLDDTTQTVESDEYNPFGALEDTQMREQLAAAIASLPEKEAMVMSLYYAEELNLKEIGEVLGVSESRVSQIHGQALARIRVKVNAAA